MPKSTEPRNAVQDLVIREFPTVGKYRVRLVKGKEGDLLDVREYINTHEFEGFTRRGIRLSMSEIEALRQSLEVLLKKG